MTLSDYEIEGLSGKLIMISNPFGRIGADWLASGEAPQETRIKGALSGREATDAQREAHHQPTWPVLSGMVKNRLANEMIYSAQQPGGTSYAMAGIRWQVGLEGCRQLSPKKYLLIDPVV